MEKVKDCDISIMVNNVGVMSGRMEMNSEEELLNYFTTNTVPQLMLTKKMIS